MEQLHKIHTHNKSLESLVAKDKLNEMNKARIKEHEIYPEVRPHHIGALLHVEEPI